MIMAFCSGGPVYFFLFIAVFPLYNGTSAMEAVMHTAQKICQGLGIILILSVGLIHVFDAPDSFEDAMYKGWLFYTNGAGAVAAAAGILRRKPWGWNLGFLIASCSLAGYVISRTLGLPLIPAEPGAWLEPLGVASLVTEGLFVLLFMMRTRGL
jgi:hypothetical protein